MRRSDQPAAAAPLKPIGGFIGLETVSGASGRAADFESPYQLRFWNGRAALAHLLASLEVRRVWMPAYVCLAPAVAAARDGREVIFYPVGSDLSPDGSVLARGLRRGDAVLGVDYFGAPAQTLPELARRFPDLTWIQDRAQALWPDPAPWGTDLLYSPRKVVGAPDGGVLVSRGRAIDAPDWEPDPDQSRIEPSMTRAQDPLGTRSQAWFPAYQAAEAAMTCAPLPMSALSETVLDGLDTRSLIERRRRNARILLSRLGEAPLFKADRLLAGSPLGVPVLTADAAAVQARMAEAGVFCARHWADLPSPPAEFAEEHALSRRLLTLPCDHRYDEDDMARVADTFLGCR